MNVTELETINANYEHINQVRMLLRMVIVELLHRGEIHDQSKFSEAELQSFAAVIPKLKGSTYGSDEYKASLRELGPALAHHYHSNRHHPEFFENGIRDMNLIDLIEMYVDWLASTLRHADGSILKSIEINKTRFDMGDLLTQIFMNTARDFTVDGIINPYISPLRESPVPGVSRPT